MTTKQAFRLLPALLLSLLILATGCDTVTDSPPPLPPGGFTIESRQVATNATLLEGTFEAQGYIGDRGTVREVLDSPEPLHLRGSIHGVKTLESEKGTITIEFYASLSHVDPTTLQAKGGFWIVKGSGAYVSLQGNGEIDLEVAANASPGEITRVLEGTAEYAR